MQQFRAVFPQGLVYLIISPSFPSHTVSHRHFPAKMRGQILGGMVLKDVIYSFQNTEGVWEGQFEIM